MIVGNYGGHLAYATDPLFCMAYALDFINKDDPATMMFRNHENHPVSFTGDGLIICQLLVQDCTEHKYERTTCNGCLLIPRGMQFTKELFPEIVVLRNHAAPYCDPKTGKEAPFITMGPFSSKDTLFPGVIARDLELYTTEEVMSLRSTGILKSPSGASLSLYKLSLFTSLAQIQSAPTTPKVTPGSPKVESDSSSKRWDYTSSLKSHKHPVSVAAGSSTSLERSMSRTVTLSADGVRTKVMTKIVKRSREHERLHTHQKGKSSHHASVPQGRTMAGSKCGRSAESGHSSGHPHSKE